MIKKETKRIDWLKSLGIAVCDMRCAECRREVCTGARAIKGGTK